MRNVIETCSLSKRFSRSAGYRDLMLRPFRRQEIVAVDGVSIQVRGGELFGLLGPNGAGKTTLIKMLCTLILPTSGTATVGGYDVVKDETEVRRLVGLVDGQERSFFWRLTGRQNLEFFASLYNLPPKEARLRIEEVLALVRLIDDADRRYTDYSTGMRQKLAVARGLLSTTQILFMDEPTRSLDPLSGRELRAFIREKLVGELGRTVFLVTQRLEEAEELCDRIAIMNQGRVIACGTLSELKGIIMARDKYEIQIRNLSPDRLALLSSMSGVVACTYAPSNPEGMALEITLGRGDSTLPEVMRFLVKSGAEIASCTRRDLSLGEVFIDLVSEDGAP